MRSLPRTFNRWQETAGHIADAGRRRLSYWRVGFPSGLYAEEHLFPEVFNTFTDPANRYAYFHHYFLRRAPAFLREHRAYFRSDQACGEDAFHAMWWLLFLWLRPRRALEVGVHLGQTISLWGLVAKIINLPIEITGLSPFSGVGDTVSEYQPGDYEPKVRKSFEQFGLTQPHLTRALSTERKGIEAIQTGNWELIYLDGGHDFETVLSDYRVASESLAQGGVLVFDDAALKLGFEPPRFSFAGHPGPSQVAADYAARELRLLGVVGHNVIFIKD